jgi:hypothetical protein
MPVVLPSSPPSPPPPPGVSVGDPYPVCVALGPRPTPPPLAPTTSMFVTWRFVDSNQAQRQLRCTHVAGARFGRGHCVVFRVARRGGLGIRERGGMGNWERRAGRVTKVLRRAGSWGSAREGTPNQPHNNTHTHREQRRVRVSQAHATRSLQQTVSMEVCVEGEWGRGGGGNSDATPPTSHVKSGSSERPKWP